MSQRNPLVSVIIPTIPGREVLLRRAKISVKKQTYPNIELIVVNRPDLNAPQSRNIGIRSSKGKYIAFLDDDDEWDATKIAAQVEYMEANPECGLCICWSWDERFGMTRVSKPISDPTFTDLIKSFNLSSTSSYLIRRRFSVTHRVVACPMFDETLSSGQEYDLALRISLYSKIHTIPRIMMKQYGTPGQISTNWLKKIRGQFQFAHKWGNYFDIKSYIKTLGLISLFAMGYIVGNKIYEIITIAKEIYENG